MIVYLAGTSTLRKHPDIIRKSNYFLESFYSIKPWQLEYLLNAKDFLLDSGAFTFMASKRHVDFIKYVDDYAEFVNKYRINKFFELDIESVVGWDEYTKLNDRLRRQTHTLPIPVFHKERGKDWFLNAVKEYPYIAFGGIAIDRKTMKKKELDAIPWFIKEARKQGCKIHGLGFTSTSLFEKIRFDTIDSTTWSMGGRMGNLCFMTNGQMRQYYPSKTGKKPKDIEKINVFNYLEWCKFQEYAERSL